MAAVLHTNDVVQTTVVSRYCGQTCMNTFPGRLLIVSGEPPAVEGIDALNVALQVGGGVVDRLADCMPINCQITGLWTQVVRPIRLRARKVSLALNGNYVEVDGLTANIQAAIERYGETANKHSIGGIRVPIGTDDSCFDDGELTPAMKTALELLGVEMRATLVITGTGWQFRWIPAVGLPKEEFDLIDCVGTQVQDTVRVIRRRTVGLGI